MYPASFHPSERTCDRMEGVPDEAYIRFVKTKNHDGTPLIISYWKPTEKELKELNDGYGVFLSIVADKLPALTVTTSPLEAGVPG